MAFVVKNPEVFNMGIDLWIKRVEDMYVQAYRDLVWKVFCRILNQTPQFTGKAVANWNIGVGAPNYEYDDTLGDPIEPTMSAKILDPAHRKKDLKWINVAKARNRPKMAMIKRDTRVYINNGVRGDNDKGRSSELYLDSLQDPAYWAVKLRAYNQPYETAQESMMFLSEQVGRVHGQSFRAGGSNMGEYP